MTDEEIKRAARAESRSRALRDAATLRLVGAAVTVAAKAQQRRILGVVPGSYLVSREDMERLQKAAREAGFKV